MVRSFAALAALGILGGCNTKIISSDYDYSYLTISETYASTRRFVGELYILDPKREPYKLEFLDHVIEYNDSELRPSKPSNLSVSKVSGASITLDIPELKTKVSGEASFEAKVDQKNLVINSLSRTDVSDKIEQLYAKLRK
ncbi:hypothetical protein [Labrenzia sp. 011]|uniref:hypothetical protein n=1 Tax=Labrenzia sp. 011 TaxID=2171494 RepID=UPI0010575A81|nr:hypothetical protein [Labrenzia sp. 011]